MKTVIDAYAWVEIFIGSKSGEKAREIIQKAEETFTTDTVIAEIARKYLREGVEESIIRERLVAIEEISDIVSIDKDIAIESAKCYMELADKAKRDGLKTPSLFDAIVLATARTFDAKIVTGDEHFRDISETLWIG
ncbi:MAG: PIN domain-containing protein [Candidatus Bathyarchaeota archaeon]|nr:PIN domain-containing protein [Candidatus Bathyarchaeota archaeon]